MTNKVEMRNKDAIRLMEKYKMIDDSLRWYDPRFQTAFEMAINALRKLDAIQSNQPPTDDWEKYADRLYELAYQHGYKDGEDVEQENAAATKVEIAKMEYERGFKDGIKYGVKNTELD